MIRDQVQIIGGGALAIVRIDEANPVDGITDAEGNPVQWTYLGMPVTKIQSGYGGAEPGANPPNDAWAAIGTAQVNIYNMREANNSYINTLASARMGNGVRHSGDYPDGFEMQPLEEGGVYPAIPIAVGGALEYWAWQSNGEDGPCT